MRGGALRISYRSLPRPSIFFYPRAAQVRHSSYDLLRSELTSRELPLLFDNPTPTPSHLLDATLADFLLPSPISSFPPYRPGGPTGKSARGFPPLRPGHHLVYFPPVYPLSTLLPDGTDPSQSPGEPFVRRMWAGGRIQFFPFRTKRLRLASERAVCMERITDVAIKGLPGDEKVFVTVERRFSGTERDRSRRQSGGEKAWRPSWHDPLAWRAENVIRRELARDEEAALVEQRNLVFMRHGKDKVDADATREPRPDRIIRPLHKPTFSHELTPTAALLFRFSALTWNAHRIHLDKQYCRELEGHRNLLVHGPLSLVLMLEVLERHLAGRRTLLTRSGHPKAERKILEIEYRNIAPLYAEEPMKVCGREKEGGEFDLWIEGRDGGYAVKGVAKTMTGRQFLRGEKPERPEPAPVLQE